MTLPEKKNPFEYDLWSSLQLKPVEAAALLSDACIPAKNVPPAQVSVDFSDLNLRSGAIDPTGNVRVDLFNGSINVNEIGLFDLGTKVPELDFNMDADNIQLSEIGKWAGMGEMDGILHSHAHDVVVLGWLPTQYDFLFEAKPLHYEKIHFAPDAMKSIGKLFAADAMSHLPGVAEWLTFGWPSRLLIGGFDIWLAGVSLFSHGGSIMMEALEPKNLPTDVADEQKQNHYIIYGKRFKIPLNAPHYPVLVDVSAVSNYVGQLVKKFDAIKEKQNLKENKHEKPQLDCASPRL